MAGGERVQMGCVAGQVLPGGEGEDVVAVHALQLTGLNDTVWAEVGRGLQNLQGLLTRRDSFAGIHSTTVK